MTQIVQNNFNNHSGPGDYLGGNRSKFTESQLADRTKLHAVAIATGYPTVAQIVQTWKDKYGIDITIQSEKEWRKSNRNKIEKKKQELIESREIDIPVVSDRALSDNLMTAMIQTGRFCKDVQKKAMSVMGKISVEDAGTKSSFAKNKELVMIFTALSEACAKVENGMTKKFLMMSELSGRVKLSDSKSKEADEDFQEKLEAAQGDDKEFDPADAEISDEDRQALK